ncbi:hypothetical protein ABPG72_009597 [Tetrahymena utriculariae]
MQNLKKYSIRKEDLNIDYWEYVNEGNQHLLIKTSDRSSPIFGFLLRFNKQTLHHSNHSQESHNKQEVVQNEKQIEDKNKEQENIKQLSTNLQNYVQKYLFKDINILNKFLQEAIVVDYSQVYNEFQEFVSKVEEKIKDQRSEFKREKKIDISQAVEIVENFQQDYGFKDSRFSATIEIKPKSPLEEIYSQNQIQEELQKYLEYEQNIILNEFKQADEYEKCRFFKMQLNKLQNDPECKQLSKYQPINFYRGNVAQEINNLLQTPLNNLIITQYKGNESDSSLILEQVDELKVAINSILKMIQLYADFNIKLKDVFKNFISEAGFYLQKNEEFYYSVLKEILLELNNDATDLQQQLQNDFNKLQEKKQFYQCKLVIKFLLSVAFRDLSILINVYTTQNSTEILDGQNQHQKMFLTYKNANVQNELIHSRIAIIDNDLKPLITYDKYMMIEKTNLSLYFQHLLKQKKQ